MKPDSLNRVLELPPRQVLRLRAAAGVTISCDAGALWLTQEGHTRDDFLSAGESLRIACAGLTLVEANGGATAKLTLRRSQASSRFIRAFRARTAFRVAPIDPAYATGHHPIASVRPTDRRDDQPGYL
ncbi:MAG TPA: DUF2917 domain-containing protein [Burkholderiales bacterium]|nr:DUF2917 domain-containing protein [Burkholderiales bacterium]